MKPTPLIESMVLLSLVLGPGCSKEDVRPINCYPTKIGDRILVYNKNNQVIVDDVSAYYQYDTDGKIITALGPSGNTVYTYDGSKNLTRADMPDGSYIEYLYNGTGQLLSYTRTYYNSSTQTTTTSKPTSYEYPNASTKNPSKMTTPGCCDTMDTHLYEYDDKYNPEMVIFPSIHSENNVIKDTWTQTWPAIQYPVYTPQMEMHGVMTYIITYNSNGYPLSIKLNSDDPIIITYDCK